MGRFSYLLPKITDNTIKGLVVDEQEYIKELNREQMYEQGAMNVDNPQKLKYAESTIRQKKMKAKYKKTDFITLRWMGDFYNSLKVLFFSDSFTISSDSLIWANYLEPQSRFEKALGLTEKSKGILQERLKDKMIRWVRFHR